MIRLALLYSSIAVACNFRKGLTKSKFHHYSQKILMKFLVFQMQAKKRRQIRQIVNDDVKEIFLLVKEENLQNLREHEEIVKGRINARGANELKILAETRRDEYL